MRDCLSLAFGRDGPQHVITTTRGPVLVILVANRLYYLLLAYEAPAEIVIPLCKPANVLGAIVQ